MKAWTRLGSPVPPGGAAGCSPEAGSPWGRTAPDSSAFRKRSAGPATAVGVRPPRKEGGLKGTRAWLRPPGAAPWMKQAAVQAVEASARAWTAWTSRPTAASSW